MNIEDIEVYQTAMSIAENIRNVVKTWENFNKFSIGTQTVRASDSIAVNISEGFGRYHYKENKLFCYYARGSLYETKTWLKKANNRNLIDKSDNKILEEDLEKLAKKLNAYINSIGKK
ncbi:MAG: four helix bundle protein [Ignavibacteriales bacterium CG_4_9_14_3_um_filter_30_11]|nr:MAG: four helix bundle protein [Ignavibacteriales bacterium CG_4_9_14_3_um_filter_30_11]